MGKTRGRSVPGMVLLLTYSLASPMTPAAGASLSLTTEDSPPTNMKANNGKVVGIVTEKVKAIMTRTRTPYTLTVFPWARAYNTALHQANACVFSTTRTAERDPHFKWVGPLYYSDWVLFHKTDHPLKLNTLEDARPYLIGTYNGDALDDYLRKRGFRLDTTFDAKENLRELLNDKIALWATDLQTARILIRKYGARSKVAPALVIKRVGLYLACNPGVSDTLINKMKAAEESMKKDGTARTIEQKYHNWPES